MFNRSVQQNITNKNTHTSASKNKNHSPAKNTTTYSALARKKINNSQLFDYQIGNFGDHLYQGCLLNNKKHGEGLLILNTGVVVIGNWQKGKLNGYALFITPFGGKIHANYCLGLLEGWVILEYSNSFQIVRYSQDKYQLLRRRYDQSDSLWTEALYTSQGKLQKVLKIEKTANYTLPTFLVDKQLQTLYTQIILKQQTNLSTKKITITKINNKFQFFGYTNNDKIPHGLGVIFSNTELYIGNFQSGSLDLQGLILFENGLIYKGDIYMGKIWGNGAIYDINLDQTNFISVSQDGIQLILEQTEGCKVNSVPFKIGKTCNISSDKGFTSSIDHLCQSVAKYYFRFNSLSTTDYNWSSNNQQTMKINDDTQKQNERPPSQQPQPPEQSQSMCNYDNDYNFKKYAQQQAERLQLFSLNDQYSNQINTQMTSTKNNNTTTLRYPNTANQCNNESLQFEMEQIRPVPHSPIQTIPTQTPSFDQLVNCTKKVLYPHLLEFQMTKSVFTTCKFSNIGKIVSNSLKIAETLS